MWIFVQVRIRHILSTSRTHCTSIYNDPANHTVFLTFVVIICHMCTAVIKLSIYTAMIKCHVHSPKYNYKE